MPEPVATLIGDLVASKRTADRRRLQRSMVKTLRRINDSLKPRQPLEPTVGDEFQGAFADVVSAVQASLLLRLELLISAETDSRYGLGYGTVAVFKRAQTPPSQDGPGWWSARAAIDKAKRFSEVPRTAFARTYFDAWPENSDVPPAQVASISAFLICRDAMVHQMTPRRRRLLLGLLRGQKQELLAAKEGITQPAVSQGLMRSGAFAIQTAQEILKEAR